MIRRQAVCRVSAALSSSRLFAFSLCNTFATFSQTTRQEVSTWGSQGSGGILASLGFTNGSVGSVPMTDPFPGTVEPQRLLPPKEPSKTQVTTLANGFRVASEDIWGPTAGIGLGVASGSQYETSVTSGISHFLEYMAFKGTHNRTHFRVMQELNGYGAHTTANASREQMYYSVECLKANLPAALEVVCDAVFNPKFNEWEVDEIKTLIKSDLDELKKNPQALMSELLTGVAYQGGLGNPLISSQLSLDQLDTQTLAAFHAENYTPERMVLSVAGMQHDALLQLAEPLAGILRMGEHKFKIPPSVYVGGEFKKPEDDQLCHVVMAFDVEGGWEDVKTACAMSVLMYLMGGGGSFSSGGPGKGMHSRLYLNVLTRYGWVHNFSAICQIFDKTCLTGVYGAVPSEWAPDLVNVMTEELIGLSKNISDVELSRAKNAAIGQVLMTLESRAVAAEDITRQVLTYGHRKPQQVFLDGLGKVTKEELMKLVSNMLKTPLSMASMGNVSKVPRYATVAKRFG